MQRGAFYRGVEQQGIEFEIVLDVRLLLAFLDLVQGRLRNIDVAALDQDRHLAIEEGEQQRAYVTSIDIRICHYNYTMIPQLIHVEIVAPDAAAQRRDECSDFRRREHLVEASLFDIENFSL